MDFRVVSIGTLSRHELWPQDTQPRTPHATTTLIRSEDRVILVDPGLPPQVVAARLAERAGLEAAAVTDVFLTNFRPSHRWGITAFPNARWLISETEREAVGKALIEQIRRSPDPTVRETLEHDVAILKRCSPAPDKLARQVDLFPLPGFTPGTAGLILTFINYTALIAGDAVATSEHLEQGRVLRGCFDAQAAKESLLEAVEIADIIVPGHDNIVINPTKRRM